jgi:hypothetical protein
LLPDSITTNFFRAMSPFGDHEKASASTSFLSSQPFQPYSSG